MVCVDGMLYVFNRHLATTVVAIAGSHMNVVKRMQVRAKSSSNARAQVLTVVPHASFSWRLGLPLSPAPSPTRTQVRGLAQ